MSTREPWHPRERYYEGERCSWQGESYEARFDLPKGIKPTGEPDSHRFWKKVSVLPHHLRGNSAADNTRHTRSAPANYSYIKKVIR